MRKIYISLISALLLSTATSAQSLFRTDLQGKVLTHNSEKVFSNEKSHIQLIKNNNASVTKNSEETDDQPLSEVPEGELLKDLYGASHGYLTYARELYTNTYDGYTTNIVTNGNELYIENPISSLLTGTWLKGVKKPSDKKDNPDTIIAKLPQPIMIAQVQDVSGDVSIKTLYAQNINISPNTGGDISTELAKNQNAVFTWDGDTLRKVSQGVLGITDLDGTWYGYGDDALTIFKEKSNITTVPNSIEQQKCKLTYKTSQTGSSSKIISYAKDDKFLYLKNTVNRQDVWSKGAINGNKVIFEKQYLGIDTINHWHMYYVPAEVSFEYDEYWDEYNPVPKELSNLEYSYDESSGTLKTENAFFVNQGKVNLGTSNMFLSPKLSHWDDIAYMPQDPEIDAVDPYDPSVGYGSVRFVLQKKDAEGNLLDENQLFFVIYLGDENHPYTFTPDKHTDINEDMTEIPSTFATDYNFQIRGLGHTVFINDEAFSDTSVGVQAIYKGGNTVTKTEIIWDIVPAGINTTSSKSDTARSIIYYDLTGRRVQLPSTGIYIKATRNADGSITSTKIAK